MRRIGIVWSEDFLLHDTGPGHPERPDRLIAVKRALDAFSHAGAELETIAPVEADEKDLLRVHSRPHIQLLSEIAERRLHALDADTPVCPDSWRVARLAAGGVIELVRATLDGRVDTGFAFPRPPGHHAERERGMGFCLINNAAVAAAWAAEVRLLERVAIVDFDVHHGNGTQQIFYYRRDVLYASTHRYPFYPGTGAFTEVGEGDGEGRTVNVPMPAGAADDDFVAIYAQAIDAVIREFSPSLVIVSAGFDIYSEDPLGGMRVTVEGFGAIARAVRSAAEAAGAKSVFVLEGGYNLEGLQNGVSSILTELAAPSAATITAPETPLAARLLRQLARVQAPYWHAFRDRAAG